MKLLFVYDSPELRDIGKINYYVSPIDQIHVLTIDENGKKRNLYDVATFIKKLDTEDEPSIIFIDQYLECADKDFKWLQNNSGIALVKFLRMMDVRHHLVLVTPYTPLQLIRENPSNLITTSKGISFTKYLYEFSNKTQLELETVASRKFDEKQDLKPCILAEFRLPEDERHNWANWWGIVQLIDTQRNIFPNEQIKFFCNGNIETPYPHKVFAKLKELKSQQAIYLFGHSPADFIKATNELIIGDLEKQSRVVFNDIQYIEKRLTASNRKNPKHDYWVDMKDYFHNLAVENLASGNSADFYSEEQKMDCIIEQKKLELNQLKEKGTQLELSLEEIKASGNNRVLDLSTDNNLISEIIKVKKSLTSTPPKILYIDDQAKEGWSEIFQLLLYGKMSYSHFLFIYDCSSDIDTLFIYLKKKILDFRPDLILLDIRLKNEIGTYIQLNGLSGAKILERIRSEFPGLPVMMTTASNKAWTFQEIMNIGADAYWIKEGIDNHNAPEDIILNYYRFFWLINQLNDRKYKVLRDFSQFVKEIDYYGGWWNNFQKQLKIKPIKIRSNSEELKKLLHEVVENIRMYLHYIHLEYGINNSHSDISDSYYSSSIINKLGNVIEIIHDIKEEDYERVEGIGIDVSGMIRKRGDFDGNEIRNVRHKASHREFYLTDWEKLEEMIERVKIYLAEP